MLESFAEALGPALFFAQVVVPALLAAGLLISGIISWKLLVGGRPKRTRSRMLLWVYLSFFGGVLFLYSVLILLGFK